MQAGSGGEEERDRWRRGLKVAAAARSRKEYYKEQVLHARICESFFSAGVLNDKGTVFRSTFCSILYDIRWITVEERPMTATTQRNIYMYLYMSIIIYNYEGVRLIE